MPEHTPGPWRVENQVEHRAIVAANGQPVASTLLAGRTIKTADADARLIAAAPEMLAALETSLLYFGPASDDFPIKKQIRAALAKAKGE